MIGDFEIRFHECSGRHILYIEAGNDSSDGLPLHLARAATVDEILLWNQGRLDLVGKTIMATNPPPFPLRISARRRPWWKRLCALRG